MNRHESAHGINLKVPDLVDGRHVVVADLVLAALWCRVAPVGHELSHSLAKERLEPIVLLDNGGDENEAALVVKLELKQMSEVDEHRHFLLVAELLGL